MAYQILRMAKLKTPAQIGQSAKHTFREMPTANANAAKTPLNSHSVAKASDVLDGVKKRLETLKVRSNAVQCLEFLITASPEFFKKRTGQSYFDDARCHLEKKFGAENVVSGHVHRDETTPHAVFYVVPVDPKGKLNARHYCGGRQKMVALQDDFHNDVAKKFKLERGLKGSKAKHTTIRDFYTRTKLKTPPVPTRKNLILMTDDERFQTMKTLQAQAVNAIAMVEKFEDEREVFTAKIDGMESEKVHLKSELDMHKAMSKRIALHLKSTFSAAEFAKCFGIELIGKADIFDALQKHGQALNFENAVALVLAKMPVKNGVDIAETAKWAQAFDDAPSPPLPDDLRESATKIVAKPQVVAKPLRPR